MFRKILVANRGEIAIRAFRAATEVDATTVAVYPVEDRLSEHRMKADEAYVIGEEGHPVRAYLDPEEIVRVAREAHVDAIYPGYGFLSENPSSPRSARATASPSSVPRPRSSSSPATRPARSLRRRRPASRPSTGPRRRPTSTPSSAPRRRSASPSSSRR